MAKTNKTIVTDTSNKKTSQGAGTYTKKSNSGGETFYDNLRSGSSPNKAHRRKKPYRGQGR
jgi:hypothetical protein